MASSLLSAGTRMKKKKEKKRREGEGRLDCVMIHNAGIETRTLRSIIRRPGRKKEES